MDTGHPHPVHQGHQGQPGQPGQVNPDGTLDMELNLHDFGEGIGVDMRDFPSHSGDEGDEAMATGMVVTLDEAQNGARVHPSSSHLTPNVTPSVPGRSSHPPGSITPNDGEAQSGAVNIDDMFKAETGLDDDDDEDGDDGDATPHAKRVRVHADQPGGFTYVDKDGEAGRRKIRIEYISDKSRRHITFSKRKAGIMKKAYELSILTGTQVLLLVVSETGLVYTFTTTKLQPLVQKAEGKNLIQACLNAPDGFGPDGQPLTGPVPATKAKNGGLAIRPHKLTASASAALAASAQAASANQNGHDDHAQAQADAAAAIGQGTPSAARPKKRMPSGKGKKAQAAAAAEAAAASNGPSSNDQLVPPVPSIPDMHRQSSPHSAHMVPPSLASPMSGGYHIPPEYHHSPTNATFGYATHPASTPGEYNQGYYAPPPGQGHPHHHGQHPGYLNVGPGGHPHGMYQEDPRDRRMMMEQQGGRMGMGM